MQVNGTLYLWRPTNRDSQNGLFQTWFMLSSSLWWTVLTVNAKEVRSSVCFGWKVALFSVEQSSVLSLGLSLRISFTEDLLLFPCSVIHVRSPWKITHTVVYFLRETITSRSNIESLQGIEIDSIRDPNRLHLLFFRWLIFQSNVVCFTPDFFHDLLLPRDDFAIRV